MSGCRLLDMWNQQHSFMKLLQERRGFPDFPVDVTSKQGQQFLKSITFNVVEELIEANQLLKNSKSHRATEVPEFDRERYVEELCDGLHFLFEVAIASGITMDELHAAYMAKGRINTMRIEGDY